ncbi:uncharacterized protein LOC127419660 [Myxocyprinus asiaticus]|uniref:uncharacterized protein LOC127419660 n=1 Tax=Myxocyprinus asiaticus TaxID=70543 RepID=UPI00222199A8|nr:uncharacterized protein LOC127419660 [Myxocyprinus asiaticus]
MTVLYSRSPECHVVSFLDPVAAENSVARPNMQLQTMNFPLWEEGAAESHNLTHELNAGQRRQSSLPYPDCGLRSVCLVEDLEQRIQQHLLLSPTTSPSLTPLDTPVGVGEQLTNFLEELDVLLSSLPEDGRPLVVLGDLNIHHDKPQATELNTLLASFDLEKLHTTATHRSGNQLDLIFTCNHTDSNILVTPLHVSDHYFVQFNMTLPSTLKQSPPLVSFRRNLRSLSSSRLSTAVSTSLPTVNVFTTLDVNTATDTLSSTLTTCLDNICPISSRPARATLPSPWLSDVLCEHRSDLRAAERRWQKSKDPADLEQAAG